MNKWIWYFFGVTLLVIAGISFMTATSLHCISHDYGFYFYCRHFRNKQMLMFIIEFIGSIWCFVCGSVK